MFNAHVVLGSCLHNARHPFDSGAPFLCITGHHCRQRHSAYADCSTAQLLAAVACVPIGKRGFSRALQPQAAAAGPAGQGSSLSQAGEHSRAAGTAAAAAAAGSAYKGLCAAG
jgi:hypothetical protein